MHHSSWWFTTPEKKRDTVFSSSVRSSPAMSEGSSTLAVMPILGQHGLDELPRAPVAGPSW